MSKLLSIGLLLLTLSGCASYSNSFRQIEHLLEQQKPEAALLELEKHPRSGKDKLLYLLDKAMLQRMSGLYSESNVSFEEAKKLIEKLRATSLLEQAGALTINDSAMSYEGEDYEQASIHIYEALNYIALGQLDEARVEALQVDELLKKLAEGDSDYSEDAFARYLAGLVYEAEAEPDNAMIAYRKAYQAYKKHPKRFGVGVPLFLKYDLLRLSKQLGLNNEYEAFKKEFSLRKLPKTSNAKQGEIVVLLNHSLAPIKRSVSTMIYHENGLPYRISLPVYQSRPSYISKATLIVGNQSVNAEIVDNFDAIAKASLESHKPAMVARLLARAVMKSAVSNQAQKQGGELAGFLVDAVSMATETADTRSWLTLPKNIYMSRLMLDPGAYPATLVLYGKHGGELFRFNLGQVQIKKGRKVFVEKYFIAPFTQEK